MSEIKLPNHSSQLSFHRPIPRRASKRLKKELFNWGDDKEEAEFHSHIRKQLIEDMYLQSNPRRRMADVKFSLQDIDAEHLEYICTEVLP